MMIDLLSKVSVNGFRDAYDLKENDLLGAKSEGSGDGTRSVPLTREALARLRLKARRCGAWFRDLKQSERQLLDLTISVVERVRSFMLAKVVSGLVTRLCASLESRIVRLVRSEGREMARRISEIAVGLGHHAAKSWACDWAFMQYLTINSLGSFRT